MNIKVDVKNSGISKKTMDMLRPEANMAMNKLRSGKEQFTGWVTLPTQQNQEELNAILKAATEIQNSCDLLVVIGVGGSYLGARTVIEIMENRLASCPKIVFAGYNMSASAHKKVIKEIETKDTCICVISKSGGTIEPLAAFSIIKEALIKKYGEERARQRIYAITGKDGILRDEATAKNYKTFDVPENVGGRYSVFTPVGLLPIAVAGIDIEEMLHGAKDMAEDSAWEKDAVDYAIARVAMKRQGKAVEIIECFQPAFEVLGEWLKQLYGESEGKEGKGLFPATLSFSRDLHSVGQFLQQGNQVFFETMIREEEPICDIMLPESAGDALKGKTYEEINKCVMIGIEKAHIAEKIPVITIDIPKRNAYNIGQLLYYFEMTCGVSAYMEGVNPFDQPGVEFYKKEMKKAISEI